jgi:hypothetical protein
MSVRGGQCAGPRGANRGVGGVLDDHEPVITVKATRSKNNPLITPRSGKRLGRNINGPSVIRVPDWIEQPLGKYYMYFAHHGGDHIRLAYADHLHGPWTVYERGTLALQEAKGFSGHIASPDVHVDHQQRRIRMYFHGPSRGGQKTGVAVSRDGIHFEPSETILGPFYFRVFEWRGAYYAIAKSGGAGDGIIMRSTDPMKPFEARKGVFVPGMRHAAVMLRGDRLFIFYSRIGDAPERILLATVRLTDDWTTWTISKPVDVLAPHEPYEGIEYPNKPSRSSAGVKVRQLRDPAVFEEDGKVCLFYSIAGEEGIALAELEVGISAPAGAASSPVAREADRDVK